MVKDITQFQNILMKVLQFKENPFSSQRPAVIIKKKEQ